MRLVDNIRNQPRTKRRTLLPKEVANVRNINVEYEQYRIMTFRDGVDALLSDNRKRGLSEDTNKYYLGHLTVYRRFIENVLEETVPISPNRRHLSAFIDYRTNTLGYGMNGVKTSIRAIKRYSSFIHSLGRSDIDELASFTMPKSSDNIIETFSELDIRRLLSVCDTQTFVGYRDYVVINFLLDTGVRLRELVDIRLEDVNMADGFVSILGKNRQYRSVPLSDMMANYLTEWTKVRGTSPSNHLFITQDDRKMSRRSVQERLMKYGKKADIQGVRVSPHTFRHTFAKMFVISGGDVFVLQDILGHSTLEMVRKYVRLYSKDLQRNHAIHSPLSKLNRIVR